MTGRSSETDGIEVRVVVPRDAFPSSPRPDYFSQVNCELLGLTKRAFLEMLRRPGAPAVARLGKLRLVRREAMLAFLDRLAEQRLERPASEMDGADRVLMDLGCSPRRRS